MSRAIVTDCNGGRLATTPIVRLLERRCALAGPGPTDLGGIRIWAGIVSDSETDPAQIAVWKGAIRFFGHLGALSGRRFPENRLHSVEPVGPGRRRQFGTRPPLTRIVCPDTNAESSESR